MFNLSHNEFLPYDKLNEISERFADGYKSAIPFAHGVFDDVFDPALLDEIIKEFEAGEKTWTEFKTKYEKKYQMSHDIALQPVSRAFIHNLNSEPFIRFLERLTGIQGLIPDPYLFGGGLHKIPRGGKLGVHVDFNHHRLMQVNRRINLLIYLNKDWKEEYGGHFELWDEKKHSCVTKILPTFNRMAIFTTTPTSFHGHPEPLTCPEDRSRLSLALYYYTVARGDQRKEKHGTQFLTASGGREELNLGSIGIVKRKLKALLRK
ncbi:2OG-Fe(II) oxygenase [Haliea sp. E17]|uniref:2OG-Fe(II) oxygenase n=1 Tax=Haliea sp. E17 TaxID=3401576 RepID=UPI003AB0BCF2